MKTYIKISVILFLSAVFLFGCGSGLNTVSIESDKTVNLKNYSIHSPIGDDWEYQIDAEIQSVMFYRQSDAIDELEEAIDLNNTMEKYFLTKAIWLYNEEEYKEAIEDCKKCLALNPDNWMCQNRLSLCYSNLGDIGAALTHSKRAVEIDPLVPQSQLLLGEGYLVNEQVEDAIESLKKAVDNTIASEVKNPVVYLDLAIAYYKYGDYENAMQNAMISKNMKFAERKVKQDLERETDQLISNIQQKMNKK